MENNNVVTIELELEIKGYKEIINIFDNEKVILVFSPTNNKILEISILSDYDLKTIIIDGYLIYYHFTNQNNIAIDGAIDLELHQNIDIFTEPWQYNFFVNKLWDSSQVNSSNSPENPVRSRS